MSGLSQDVFAAQGVPITVVGNGGGSGTGTSTFSTIYVADTAFITSLASASISSVFLESDEAFVSSLSSFFINAVDIGCSTISTLGVVLDGNLLTSAGSELLLNGVPIATTSNLSSIGDWAKFPANSTVQMNSNPIIGSIGYTGIGTVSTTDLQTATAFISSLVCDNIQASSISSLVVGANSLFVSSINGGLYPPLTPVSVSSFESASVSSLTTSSINGTAYPPPQADVSQWAKFAAVSSIFSGSGSTDDLNLVGNRYINSQATGETVTVDRGLDVGGNAFYRVIAQNGAAGEISLTANPGALGNYGRIGLTANGGVVGGIGIGGLVEITANTPSFTLSNATSAIKLSAAGINSYAGAIPSVGSLLGYNFIYGTLGVNLCAGLPPGSIPNTVGTTYLYGYNGIVLNSDVYTTTMYPYWNGLTNPADLSINGRAVNIGLGNYNALVNLSTVGTITFSGDARSPAAIVGVSTINGAQYPPPVGSIPADLVVSTLTAAQQVSTPALFVSSINGVEYIPGGVSPDLVVSTLTAADGISTARIAIGASNYIQGDKGPNMIIHAEGPGGVEILNATGAPGTLLVANISSVSTINGAAYPPTAAVGADLIVSTLTAATYVATQQVIFDPSTFIINLAEGEMQIHAYDKVEILGEGRTAGTLVVAHLSSVVTINGSDYPPTAGGVASLNTLTGALDLRSPSGTIDIGDDVDHINLDVIPNLNPSFDTITFPQVAGSNVGEIIGVSSINGAAFPPTAVVGANLIVSTLTAATSVSTPALFVSSVNGAAYPPASSGGIQSTIANAGSYVSIDATGGINISTLIPGLPNTKNLNVYVNDSINFASEAGAISFVRNSDGSEISMDINGHININGSSGNTILIDTDGYITLTGGGSGSVNIVNLSTINSKDINNPIVSTLTAATSVSTQALFVSSINGAEYNPSSGGVPSSIAYGASYVSILPDGGIVTQAVSQTYSVTSGNLLTLNSGQNGISLIDSDQGANMKILGSIDVGPTTTAFNIGSVPTNVSSLYVSSVNGAVYPPPSPGGSPNGLFSTLAVSSFVTANDLIAFSSLVIGDDNVSTSAYFYNRGEGSADTFLSLGTNSTTGVQGVLRVTNTYGAGAATLDVAALTSISSINNLKYNPLPSTFTSLYTSSFFTSSLNGQPINNLNFSTLSINGLGSITLERNPGNLQSAPIFFKTGSETIADGVLEVCKSYAYTDASTKPYSGLLVGAFSTLGAAQPIIAGSILLCPTPNEYVGAPITGNTAGNIIFPLSTIVGISTINGTKLQAPVWVAGGVDTIITTNISTANVNIAINPGISSISATGTAKFFITGQACYTAPGGANTVASWTIARSSTYPPTAVSSVNLASGGGFISANSVSGNAYRLSGVLTPATYTSATPFSIVDTPPPGTYWYSLWAAGSTTTPITTENVTMTILQVAS